MPDAFSFPAVVGPGTPVLRAFAASASTIEVSSAHVGTLSSGVDVAFVFGEWMGFARGNSIYVEYCNEWKCQKY